MLYFLTGCFCMIAVSFSQLDGWVSLLYLVAVVAVTIRLLRNLDAFSLELGGDGDEELVGDLGAPQTDVPLNAPEESNAPESGSRAISRSKSE
jgi:hypothetical protein